MYNMTREQAMSNISYAIENRKRCISLIDTIKEVVKQFDGKVINRRFEEALRAATGGIIKVELRYNLFEISVYATWSGKDDGKTPIHMTTDNNEYYLTSGAYIGETFERYAYFNKNGFEVTKLTESGKHRLIADNLIKTLDKRRAEIETEINNISESLKHIDEYKATIAELENQIKTLNNIPRLVKAYFDLDVTLKYN